MNKSNDAEKRIAAALIVALKAQWDWRSRKAREKASADTPDNALRAYHYGVAFGLETAAAELMQVLSTFEEDVPTESLADQPETEIKEES